MSSEVTHPLHHPQIKGTLFNEPQTHVNSFYTSILMISESSYWMKELFKNQRKVSLLRLLLRNVCRWPWWSWLQDSRLSAQRWETTGEKLGKGGRVSPFLILSQRQHFPDARKTSVPQWKVVRKSSRSFFSKSLVGPSYGWQLNFLSAYWMTQKVHQVLIQGKIR